jgi:hypothetical protein
MGFQRGKRGQTFRTYCLDARSIGSKDKPGIQGFAIFAFRAYLRFHLPALLKDPDPYFKNPAFQIPLFTTYL